LAAKANASKEKAAGTRHADRIMRCFRQFVGGGAKWRTRPVVLAFSAAALSASRWHQASRGRHHFLDPTLSAYCGSAAPLSCGSASGTGPALL
jgi:hypothetical protein